MKNLFTSLLLFLFVFTFQNGFSQVDIIEEKTEIANDNLPKEKSLLWEISGEDLKTPSYLYGTIHMIDKKDFFLTDATKAAIKKADLVTFEINMEEMNNIFAQLGILNKAYMADNLSLSDLLSEEDYKLVKNHFQEKVGIPIFLFERMKPMFLTVMADMDMETMQGGMQSGEIVSYEMEIMEMAKAQDAKMDGLETIEFQMSVFDSIPYQAQAQMLVDAIKMSDSPEADTQFDMMVEMYKNQDIQAMVSMIESDEAGMGDFEDILLTMRNKNWIPIMGNMMIAQPTFFAVGAGHLAGPNGVIALLREAGYSVKAIF